MNEENKPHGRQEVVEALMEAAAELFSKRGVKAVSMREIANLAGVNYGLIHRHFGSKDTLRRKTQEYLAGKMKIEVGEPVDFEDAISRIKNATINDPRMTSILARSLLEGSIEGNIQDSFPNMQKLVDLVHEEQKSATITKDLDARYVVAGITALGFGLTLFKDFLTPAVNLDKEPDFNIVFEVFNGWLSLIKNK